MILKTTKQSSDKLKPGMLVSFITTESISDIAVVLSIKKHNSLFHAKVLTCKSRVYDWYVGVTGTIVHIYE